MESKKEIYIIKNLKINKIKINKDHDYIFFYKIIIIVEIWEDIVEKNAAY